MNFNNLEAIFFDFDGVLADSLHIKANAFMSLFQGLTPQQAQAAREHFYRYTGRSRQSKLTYVYENILKQPLDENRLADLCRQFENLTVEQVAQCREIPGVTELLNRLPKSIQKFVVSGTPELELQEIVKLRGIAGFFKECRGTPVLKEDNIKQLISAYKLDAANCLMVGDGLVDQHAANLNQLFFVGVASSDNSHPFCDETLVMQDMHSFAKHLGLSAA